MLGNATETVTHLFILRKTFSWILGFSGYSVIPRELLPCIELFIARISDDNKLPMCHLWPSVEDCFPPDVLRVSPVVLAAEDSHHWSARTSLYSMTPYNPWGQLIRCGRCQAIAHSSFEDETHSNLTLQCFKCRARCTMLKPAWIHRSAFEDVVWHEFPLRPEEKEYFAQQVWDGVEHVG